MNGPGSKTRTASANSPIITFDGVSKSFDFTSGKSHTILESLIATVSRKQRPGRRLLKAVDKVTFEIMRGDALGIIGRNGSGKSTVLKLATGIIKPTSGRVVVRGRVSALLELGAGFHSDLTGRENIYLNGSILGMTKQQIESQFDAIVDFSELEEFIDMPVKHYSSGMYMRLGFSVAIHVHPDVLIVDEILAVGDQTFQDRCIERIYEMKKHGTTIIMVSHNLDTIKTICSRLVWLEHGKLQAEGPSNQVIARYLEHLHGSAVPYSQLDAEGEPAFRRWGTREIEITGVRLLDSEGNRRESYRTGDPLVVEIDYLAHKPINEPEFGLAIVRQDGVQVSGPNNRLAGLKTGLVFGKGTIRYRVQSLPLLPSTYHLTAAIHDSRLPKAYDFHEQAYTFRVPVTEAQQPEGLVTMQGDWELEVKSPDSSPDYTEPEPAGAALQDNEMPTSYR